MRMIDIAVINEKHRLVQETAMRMIDLAIEIGEELAEAKKECPHGKWEKWIERNLSFNSQQVGI